MSTETLASPGSVNEFAKRMNADPKRVLGEYTVALAKYKKQLPGEGRAVTTVDPEDQSNTDEEK